LRLLFLTECVGATLFLADADLRVEVDFLVLLVCMGVPSASGAKSSSPSLALPRSNTLVSSKSSPCGCTFMRDCATLDLRWRTISSMLPCRGLRLKFLSASILVSTATGVPVMLVFSRKTGRLVASVLAGVGAGALPPLRSRGMFARPVSVEISMVCSRRVGCRMRVQWYSACACKVAS